eukprot:gene7023-9594_t
MPKPDDQKAAPFRLWVNVLLNGTIGKFFQTARGLDARSTASLSRPCLSLWSLAEPREMEPVMQEENINKIVEQTDAILISSSKVEGVGVYRPSGDRIGTIKHIMINKRTGQVAYAVMNFGGFLGLGEEGYPIAWGLLTFRELPDRVERKKVQKITAQNLL